MLARISLCLLAVSAFSFPAYSEVVVDADAFGQSLGGWKARKGKAAEYEISGSLYRTYQPEVTPSPDEGIFVSVRIDHVRGFLASDDYASLELSFSADGTLVSAQSSLALQGRTITSELIKGGASATTSVAAPGIESAVKVGTDLVADLSSKLLREKIVEPGRVSFPAAIRHNYNLLYRTIKAKAAVTPSTPAPVAAGGTPASSTPPAAPATPPPAAGSTPPPTPAADASKPATPAAQTPHLVPTNNPPPAATPPAPATPAPAPATPPAAAGTTATGKKEIPLPEVKPWNGSNAPQTPLPAEKQKSAFVELGGGALKIARDVVKEQMK